MKKKKHFFDISNLFFWIILGVILFLLLPYFKNGLYNDKKVNEWISLLEKKKIDENNEEIVKDTIAQLDSFHSWNWIDFFNKTRKIRFSHDKDAYTKSQTNREIIEIGDFSIYQKLYNNDKLILADFINQFKVQIKELNMDYQQSLNFVCSSIQFIPYTLIRNDENCPCNEDSFYYVDKCESLKDGNGCCKNVFPFAVYAPFEFVIKKTGDCDTRALLAFTILKELGFDVAVMVSESKRHSVLGVAIPPHRSGRLDYGKNNYGKKYYLWELTSQDWRFGHGVLGNDWKTALE